MRYIGLLTAIQLRTREHHKANYAKELAESQNTVAVMYVQK